MSFSKKMVIAVLAVAAIVSAAEMKIGYVNSDQVLMEYPGTRAAEERLMQFKATLEQQATDKQNEIVRMQEDLERQSLLISEQRKIELQTELQDSAISYQTFVQGLMAQDGIMMQKQMELMQPIIEKVQVAIEQVSESENYDMVLDTKAGLLYAKPVYDLTEKVIAALNSVQ